MKQKTFILIITAACAFWACEDILGGKGEDTEGASALAFTFSPESLDEGSALEGMRAGEFKADGAVTLEEGAGDNGKFSISGSDLVIEQALGGGPYTVQFRIEGPEGAAFTHSETVFVAFAGGPSSLGFAPGRLMAGAVAARGLAPVGTFSPAGGLGPYSYSLVECAGDDDQDNGKFWGGADGVTARETLTAGEYKVYIRCMDQNGKFFEDALTITVADYTPPDFDDEDFVLVPGGLVNGNLSYGSVIFTYGRNLEIPSFMLAKYETTRGLFWDVLDWAKKNEYTFHTGTGKVPTSGPATADRGRPQGSLSWRNAAAWLNAFSEKNGLTQVYYTDASYTTVLRSVTTSTKVYTNWDANGYRFPCEAEWEFAARGGEPSADSGSVWMQEWAGTNDEKEFLLKYGWNTGSLLPDGSGVAISSGSPASNISSNQQVGLMLPNALGLYDMSGSVIEWCGDDYPQLGSRAGVYYTSLPLRGPTITDLSKATHPNRFKIKATALTEATGITGFRIARTITPGS